MKRLVKNMFLGCLIGISLNGFSQEGYSYKRKIDVYQDSTKWQSVQIPDEMYDKLNYEFSDVRVFAFSKNDTIEMPYALYLNNKFEHIKHSDFKIINQTKANNGYYYTFELLKNVTISRIELDFENQNFDWKIDLEGSHNQKEWFTILEDYRILSINNSQANYSFEELNFKETNYKYYRFFVKTNEKTTLKNVSLGFSKLFDREYKTKKIDNFSVKEDKKLKTTTIEFILKNKLPIDLVKLDINKDFDFEREATMEFLTDSIKTEKGWKRNYTIVNMSGLSSEYTSFGQATPARQIFTNGVRIIIQNGDNPPLEINSVSTNYFSNSLIFKAYLDADYYLFYGKKNVKAPDYDQKYFNKVIYGKSNSTLSDEIIIPKKEEIVQKPLFENKLWLWGIMILIIGILGYFSLKMISKKE